MEGCNSVPRMSHRRPPTARLSVQPPIIFLQLRSVPAIDKLAVGDLALSRVADHSMKLSVGELCFRRDGQ